MKKKLLFLTTGLLVALLSACGESSSSSNSLENSNNYSEFVSESSKPNKVQYTITFKDEDGLTLESKKWDEGSIPFYNYEKEDTAEWNYTFVGWSLNQNGEILTIPAVSADATYFAIVSKEKNQYTITFESNGGTSVASITEDYGTSISEPTKPTKENYRFVSWTTDIEGTKEVVWPYTLVGDTTLYAQWNEKVNIKAYFKALMGALGQDPYSYIPDTLLQDNINNHISNSQTNIDLSNDTSISNIQYGGHGEQWHMVLENIAESERFYSILTLSEIAINSSIVLFNNYLDNNPLDTATHTLNETDYTAKINFNNDLLVYTLQYKTSLSIPLFGEITPQIDMTYDIKTLEKTVRIQLSENNAMKYIVTDNSYEFGLQYGIEKISRKALFQIYRDEESGEINGHIYEYVQYEDKDLLPACADFYINDEYTSVVGNKAAGLVGFKGYINELYATDEGKLLGYEVRETLTILGVSGQYNTLWLNLNNISGINSIRAIENENNTGTYANKNPHDIYLNGSTSIFEPTYNTKFGVNTSRKYDIELRKQYFYCYIEGKFTEYEMNIPMMFIQADNDKDTNFSDFPGDILSKSGINASVNLESKHIDKIQTDYAELIDIFIENKDSTNSDTISSFIDKPFSIA